MTCLRRESLLREESTMSRSGPVTMLVSYYPKEGKSEELLALLAKHWPTLRRLGLASETPPQFWRGDDKASEVAHQTPEVMAVWETMGPILENLQLTRVEPLELNLA